MEKKHLCKASEILLYILGAVSIFFGTAYLVMSKFLTEEVWNAAIETPEISYEEFLGFCPQFGVVLLGFGVAIVLLAFFYLRERKEK